MHSKKLVLMPIAAALAACTSNSSTPASPAATATDAVVTTNDEAGLAWAAAAPTNLTASGFYDVVLAVAPATDAAASFDGALTDGELPDGALADGALPDGELPDGALVDAASADGGVPGQTPNVEGSISVTVVAGAAAALAGQFFTPSSCVSATATGNVVTYSMNNCTGPLGVKAASGKYTVTFTPAVTQSGLDIALAGSGITVNGATLQLDTQATLTLGADGVTRTLQATTQSSGTGPNGTDTSRTGTYTLTWQPTTACATLKGSILTPSMSTATISDYVTCSGKCPSSGQVTRTTPGSDVTVLFNGTSTANWTETPNTQTGTIGLHCP